MSYTEEQIRLKAKNAIANGKSLKECVNHAATSPHFNSLMFRTIIEEYEKAFSGKKIIVFLALDEPSFSAARLDSLLKYFLNDLGFTDSRTTHLDTGAITIEAKETRIKKDEG